MPDNDLPRLSTLNTHRVGGGQKVGPLGITPVVDDVEMWKGWPCGSRYFLKTWVKA